MKCAHISYCVFIFRSGLSGQFCSQEFGWNDEACIVNHGFTKQFTVRRDFFHGNEMISE